MPVLGFLAVCCRSFKSSKWPTPGGGLLSPTRGVAGGLDWKVDVGAESVTLL